MFDKFLLKLSYINMSLQHIASMVRFRYFISYINITNVYSYDYTMCKMLLKYPKWINTLNDDVGQKKYWQSILCLLSLVEYNLTYY